MSTIAWEKESVHSLHAILFISSFDVCDTTSSILYPFNQKGQHKKGREKKRKRGDLSKVSESLRIHE
jgi:hypothetical protein